MKNNFIRTLKSNKHLKNYSSYISSYTTKSDDGMFLVTQKCNEDLLGSKITLYSDYLFP